MFKRSYPCTSGVGESHFVPLHRPSKLLPSVDPKQSHLQVLLGFRNAFPLLIIGHRSRHTARLGERKTSTSCHFMLFQGHPFWTRNPSNQASSKDKPVLACITNLMIWSKCPRCSRWPVHALCNFGPAAQRRNKLYQGSHDVHNKYTWHCHIYTTMPFTSWGFRRVFMILVTPFLCVFVCDFVSERIRTCFPRLPAIIHMDIQSQ